MYKQLPTISYDLNPNPTNIRQFINATPKIIILFSNDLEQINLSIAINISSIMSSIANTITPYAKIYSFPL